MSGIPDNALLQKTILVELAKSPARSVAGLSRRMGGSRPSVSRAINVLDRMGLVEKTKAGWTLTEVGRAELNTLNEQYADGLRLDEVLTIASLGNAQLAVVLREAARRLEDKP